MLEIYFPGTEQWDEKKEEFVSVKETKIVLEHSLVSLSKWESRWKKPFLSKDEKTLEETIDYIRCMTISQNVDPNVYDLLTASQIKQIQEYINDNKTATWFHEEQNRQNREVVTSELIYYWMIASSIPIECQKWHLSRLLTLIKVCSIKNQPPKKQKLTDTYRRNTALNAARRKRLGTKG